MLTKRSIVDADERRSEDYARRCLAEMGYDTVEIVEIQRVNWVVTVRRDGSVVGIYLDGAGNVVMNSEPLRTTNDREAPSPPLPHDEAPAN